MINPFCQICDIIGLIFIAANWPKMEKKLTIWSHRHYRDTSWMGWVEKDVK